MRRMKKKRGFTLIELLVTLGLMSFMMILVVYMFTQTINAYHLSTDRMDIFSSGRDALDLMALDLNGCFAIETGQQKFYLINNGDDIDSAQDSMSFTSMALAITQTQSVVVEYTLEQTKDYSIISTATGTAGVGQTTKTDRRLYALKRSVYDFSTTPKTLLKSEDICKFVLSFNIEIYDDPSHSFKQINDSTFANISYPIGDSQWPNEKLPVGLRITLRLVANAAERQERIITRVIWIPMGG